MKTWQKILIGVVVTLIAFLGYAAMQPDNFTVVRTVEIKAPVEKPFAIVADLHQWAKWSPWEKMDPTMNKTFSGATSGVGQVYDWQGNKQVGKGRMTITSLEPNKTVGIKLEFFEPFAATNDVRFDFSQTGDMSKVVWNMQGQANVIFKAMTVFKSADAMMGPDFEKGLAELKRLSETP